MSTQRLVELVHQYYPANLMEFDEGYPKSEQYQRLIRARQEALKNSGPWERLMSKLTEALPDCSVKGTVAHVHWSQDADEDHNGSEFPHSFFELPHLGQVHTDTPAVVIREEDAPVLHRAIGQCLREPGQQTLPGPGDLRGTGQRRSGRMAGST